MSPSDDDRDFDFVATELYALRPDEFVAARDERAGQAREQGRAALARAIAALRRPTQTAWLVNQLVRDQAGDLDELVQLGDELRRALEQGSGADLQQLTAHRRQIETALVRRARTLGADAGVDVTADMAREVEETLGAALVSPDAAEEVRQGRLTKPLSHSGFGTVLTSVPPAAPRRKAEARPASQPAKTSASREEAVEAARQALDEAEQHLADREAALVVATERTEELGRRVDELREQLHALEAELLAADRGARMEARRRDGARKAHDEAKRHLDRLVRSS